MKAKYYLMGLPLAAAVGLFAQALPPANGLSPFAVDTAYAQRAGDDAKPRSTRKVDSLRAPIYERISKAQEKIEKGERDEAVKDLTKLLDDKLNDYETAIVYQILATSIYIEQERYKEAIAEFEKILKLERIPESLEIASLQTLAQLYLVDEQYQKSIDYMKRWMTTQTDPGPSPYFFMAQAYYSLDDFQNVIPNIEKAIELSRARGEEPKENWYLLARAAYFEIGNYQKVRDILEFLTVNFEKPEYWLQLAAVYSELGEEQNQFSVMEVAYRQGYLDTERSLINMAQLYLYNNVPIKAAWVIEKGIKDGLIEKSGENYEILGQAYLNAQEMVKAETPLRLAAEASDDGEIWMRLGQVYAEQEEWQAALDPLQKAINSDDLKTPGFAYLLIGQTYFNIDRFEDAKRTFQDAAKFEETKSTAEQWIRHTTNEQKRRAQLTEYYGEQGG